MSKKRKALSETNIQHVDVSRVISSTRKSAVVTSSVAFEAICEQVCLTEERLNAIQLKKRAKIVKSNKEGKIISNSTMSTNSVWLFLRACKNMV